MGQPAQPPGVEIVGIIRIGGYRAEAIDGNVRAQHVTGGCGIVLITIGRGDPIGDVRCKERDTGAQCAARSLVTGVCLFSQIRVSDGVTGSRPVGRQILKFGGGLRTCAVDP